MKRFFNNLFGTKSNQAKQTRQRRQGAFKPQLEALEDRVLTARAMAYSDGEYEQSQYETEEVYIMPDLIDTQVIQPVQETAVYLEMGSTGDGPNTQEDFGYDFDAELLEEPVLFNDALWDIPLDGAEEPVEEGTVYTYITTYERGDGSPSGNPDLCAGLNALANSLEDAGAAADAAGQHDAATELYKGIYRVEGIAKDNGCIVI